MSSTGSDSRLWPIYILIIGLIAGASAAFNCPAECKCWSEIDSDLLVNCSHQGLKEIPNFNNTNITKLFLSGNNFKEFPAQYANLTKLWFLDLSENNISKLDVDALKGFNSLGNLNLANNAINNWTDLNANESFRNAPNLWDLNLSGNRLGSLGHGQDLISKSLGILNISSAHITEVNFNLKEQLPNLQNLSMDNNNLSQLTQFPTLNDKLVKLDLSNWSHWQNTY